MWKRSFIFLLALLVAVFSLSAYPAFFYGGAKTEETQTTAVEVEISTEEQEKSNQDLIYSLDESEPVALASNDVTKSVIEILEENKVKSAVIDKVKDACFLIEEGCNEMAVAYEAEVEQRENAEKEVERVHYIFVPLASYKPASQEWGAGLAVGIETKNLIIQVQAFKPITAGWDSFKSWDDTTILLGAGLRF